MSQPAPSSARDDVARVRDQLLASLLSGRYRPGERAPSVRRMAALTGRSRRSVHAAYRALADEGLLEVRWGAGTFFTERHPLTAAGNAAPPECVAAAPSSLRDLAAQLDLDEQEFARFVAYWAGYGRERLVLAVVECNGEQSGLMAREIGAALEVSCREVDLARIEAPCALDGVTAIVTSCCHRDAVAPAAAARGCPLFTLSMDRGFLPPLLDAARRGPLVMVVRDRRYGPVLRRFLRTLDLDDRVIDRIAVVEPDGLVRALATSPGRGTLFVSPLIADELGRIALEDWERIAPRRFVDPAELGRLWSHLAWLRARAAP